MRILFFSYAYPNPWQPELATFNKTMIAGLAQQHEVCVVSPVSFVSQWRHGARFQKYQEKYVAVPDVQAVYLTYYYTPKIGREYYHHFLQWSVGRSLRRTICDFQPDVILSYWAHPDGAVALRIAQEFHLPLVQIVGGSDVLLLGRNTSRRRLILDVLLHADALIAVSRHIAETLRQDGVEPRKIHVVHRGIDRNVFCPGDRASSRKRLGLPEQRPVLLGVGRLVSVKDWPTWLLACRVLVDRGMQPACYVLGEGPLRRQLEQLIQQYGLQRFVDLRGSQPQTELVHWYRAADLTVLASLSEGVPNVLLETIACGGSFVATNVGGIPEIADPTFDRLVSPQQPAALAFEIANRLSNPPPCSSIRRWHPSSNMEATNQLVQIMEAVCSCKTLIFPPSPSNGRLSVDTTAS